jgi:protocatechuate 3,4-dioxygenase beta subunit
VSALLDRRNFLLYATTGLGMLGALTVASLTGAAQEDNATKASSGGPADPSWQIVMVNADEPGEPLIVTGTIYAADGKAPVDGARLYVYQTDASGRYTRNFFSRKPRLRGWMKTGADGRYEFRTIKPGAYPGERIPAHIHATLAAPGQPEKWIEDFLFEGDPHVSPAAIAKAQGQGSFSNILKLARDPEGVWRAVRDIRLR